MWYVFDCRTMPGDPAIRVPRPLARPLAWLLTKVTGRGYDYWSTPDGWAPAYELEES